MSESLMKGEKHVDLTRVSTRLCDLKSKDAFLDFYDRR